MATGKRAFTYPKLCSDPYFQNRLLAILENERFRLKKSYREMTKFLGCNHLYYYRFGSSLPIAPNLLIRIIEDWLPKLGLSKDDPKVREAIKWEVEKIIESEKLLLEQKISYLRTAFGLDE